MSTNAQYANTPEGNPLQWKPPIKFKWFRYGDEDEEEKKAAIISRFQDMRQAEKEGRPFKETFFTERWDDVST
jgi:hypothetical protein